MPLYTHDSGERVLVPAEHPEAQRLADAGWTVDDGTSPAEAAAVEDPDPADTEQPEQPEQPRESPAERRSRRKAEQTAAQNDPDPSES
jgi:hypothetical protein